jgi:hypothetical protein
MGAEGPHCYRPLRSNAELVVRQTPAREDMSPRAHCWKRLPSSAVKTVTANTSLCVTEVREA